MWTALRSAVKRLYKKPHSDARLEYAFTLGGQRYYVFREVMDIPYIRAIAIQAAYGELELRITRELLQASLAAIMECLNKGKLTDAAIIVRDLQGRNDWIFEPDTVYKLAAVVFISENENPNDFNDAFAKEKADLFRKFKKKEFFSTIPLNVLIPHLGLSTESLETYMEGATINGRALIEVISPILSSAASSAAFTSYLRSQMEIYGSTQK